MILRMKNWKILLFGGGHEKPIYRGGGGLPKKKGGGLGQFPDLRGGAWQERGGGVFEGGWYPNAHCLLRQQRQNLNHIKELRDGWWMMDVVDMVYLTSITWFQFAKVYLNGMIMVAIIFVYKGRKHRAPIESSRF